MYKSIAAVIVTYNRLDKLKITVEKSLQESLDHIFIINNNSTDGTKEWLERLGNERITSLHLKENIGGAGGFHEGLKAALELQDIDWIVCFDDDSYPQSGMIEKFKHKNYDDSIGAVAASVYLPDGSISVMNRVRINPFKNFSLFVDTFIKRESIYISNEEYMKEADISVDASTFVGFFVRTDIVRKVGLPRKELFIYADDLIYTLQMTMAGYRLLFAPGVKFTHDCTTLVNEKDIYNPIWKVYFTYRNRIEMYRVSSQWLYLLITMLQIPGWYSKSKYYQNKKIYKKLLGMAITDALKKDFSKKLSDIIKSIDSCDPSKKNV